tara:strand:+ start:245 stop:493 length:249 start_codon:yes stop_codon:yes gene_type:complete
MTNEYTFERKVVYTEYDYVEADSEKEAWEKVNSGDIEDSELGDFYDYYDEPELIEETIGDPLVAMITNWSLPEQFELFDNNG